MSEEYKGPSTRKHLYFSLVEYFLRRDGGVATIECPEYPAVAVYQINSDELEWVRCDDPVILRGLRYVHSWSRVNEAGKKLAQDTYKPDPPYVGYDLQ
jgi:hypothetical protein